MVTGMDAKEREQRIRQSVATEHGYSFPYDTVEGQYMSVEVERCDHKSVARTFYKTLSDALDYYSADNNWAEWELVKIVDLDTNEVWKITDVAFAIEPVDG